MNRSLPALVLAGAALIPAGMEAHGRAQDAPAGALAPIALDPPRRDQGAPLLRALQDRRSVRELADRPVARRHLSELLWAANGVNRPDGRRTAPAALGKQFVAIYVIVREGVYRYDAPGHRLVPVAAGDRRRAAGTQEYVQAAPLNLIYVADRAAYRREPPEAPAEEFARWANIHAGCQAQNVSLYCASEGLGATVRTSLDPKALGAALELRPDQVILCGQTIGYPRDAPARP